MTGLKVRCTQFLSGCATCIFMVFVITVFLMEIVLESTDMAVRITKKILSYSLYTCLSTIYNIRKQVKQHTERAQWFVHGIIAALRAWLYSTRTETKTTYEMKDAFSNLLFKDIVKIPRHVAVIVNMECNIERTGSVVAWCIAIGVPKVSIYDQQGFSVAHQAAIEKYARDLLQRSAPELKSNDSDEALDAKDKLPYTCDPLSFTTPNPALSTGIDLRLSETRLTAPNKLDSSKFTNHKRARKVKSGSNEALFEDLNPHFSKNFGPDLGPHYPMLRHGYASKIQFLDAVSGGRGTVVTAVRKVCTECRTGIKNVRTKVGEEAINVKTVNDLISVGEEPDVALIFGPVLSLSGFLPWQMRLTEMIYMQDLHSATAFEFRRAMQRFSQCVHRYGK